MRMTDRSGRKWKVHSPGMLKINVDGSVNIKNPGCGLGIVVRNDKRDCLEARCVYLNNSSSPLAVELLAIKEGLKTARGMRCSNFILESDCAQAVALIENFDRGYSDYDSYLLDIKICVLILMLVIYLLQLENVTWWHMF